MKMGRLEDQVAIVTGASRGIGLAIAEEFCREGSRVVLAARNSERGHQAAEGLRKEGGRALFVQTDVTDRSQVEKLVERTKEAFGLPEILVNNAGDHAKAPFTEETEGLWDRMYRINVVGTVLPSQEIVRLMRENRGGAIINIASKAGVVGEPGHTAYSASKGAVIAMTRGMAVELAPFGIRVNAICPGPVYTDMLIEDVATEEAQQELASEAPLGRIGQPQDVAHAAVYLAAEESDWLTGQALQIDGGMSILK
ncbi:MAG: SDR family NAD(P)-dependent oxidoreductase [Anaerolineales bacterium]